MGEDRISDGVLRGSLTLLDAQIGHVLRTRIEGMDFAKRLTQFLVADLISPAAEVSKCASMITESLRDFTRASTSGGLLVRWICRSKSFASTSRT